MSERINPAARRDRYGKRINRAPSPALAIALPYVSIMLGSALTGLVITTSGPVLPPLGFMMMVTWRLVRPGFLPLWAGAALGGFDDLLSGQPFGSGILLFSLAMLAIEWLESKYPWRGFWQDWLTAGLGFSIYIAAMLIVSGAPLTSELALAIVPQILLSVLLYPILARIVAALDRIRLTRIKVID